MFKAIFFDLGGVLFTNGTSTIIEYLHAKYGFDRNVLKNTLDTGPVPDAYREGKIARDDFWKEVQKVIPFKEPVDEIEAVWIEGYHLIEGTKNIITQLSSHYKVFYVSDNVKERVSAVEKKFGFQGWFAGGIFSHEIGKRKPHKDVYLAALTLASVRPEESLFIDDKESALVPARELGMKTILFTTPEKLREDLPAYEVLLCASR